MADEELLKSLNDRIKELDIFKVREEITSDKQISIHLMNQNIQQIYYYMMKGGFQGNSAILEILHYLFSVEGVLTYCVDVIIYYFIKYEHHDIFLERSNKHVTEFNELSKVTLNEKIQFLELHGFNNLSSLFDRDFRNAIAHLSFFSRLTQTKPNSVIQYYKTKGKKRKITEITVEDIQKWNLNIARFHSHFNTQFLRGKVIPDNSKH
jgi:hypothetical protein